MQRYGSVYVVTNTVTNEQYVGQTRQPVKRRWATHINTATANVPKKYNLSKAIGEYGKESFEFKEIFYAFNEEGLNAAEIELIAELKPAYNIAKGGAGHRGVIPSPELCKKRSETIKALWGNPEWKAKQIAKLKQAHSSVEAKERGRKVSKLGSSANKKPLYCKDLNMVFSDMKDAANKLNVSFDAVKYALQSNTIGSLPYQIYRLSK